VAGGFDWAFDSELTRFYHPTLLNGTRLVAIPQVSYPIIGPSYFITPKVMVNMASYQLDSFNGQRPRTCRARCRPSRWTRAWCSSATSNSAART
jgi:hypothetical protein